MVLWLEWLRPAGIALLYFLAEWLGKDPAGKLHILGPGLALILSGSVGLESLFFGETASEKIGYASDRAYQVQSGLNHLALAAAALVVLILNWGKYADAAITTVLLLVFTFSALNHLFTAIKDRNLKPVNLLRPIMTALLIAILLPVMLKALGN